MKKILVLFAIIFCVVGCDNSIVNSNIPKLDSKVDYIQFRNKKIYLSDDFEAFVLQFKGLGCQLRPDSGNVPGVILIDDINSKDHEFYSLATRDRYSAPVEIECYDSSSRYPTTVRLTFKTQTNGSDWNLYKDKKMESWSIFPREETIISISGKKVKFGGEEEFAKDDLIKIMGNDYKEENLVTDEMIYTIDNDEYIFTISYGEVIRFSLEK